MSLLLPGGGTADQWLDLQSQRQFCYDYPACLIGKWNVVSQRVHPILVANARVDWLALQDSELTQNLTILREGILRDVFSQRASSAWQGAQPQRLTVSLLLPGGGTADQWLDFLQSQRQFWPAMTTRRASLAPISTQTSPKRTAPYAIQTSVGLYQH